MVLLATGHCKCRGVACSYGDSFAAALADRVGVGEDCARSPQVIIDRGAGLVQRTKAGIDGDTALKDGMAPPVQEERTQPLGTRLRR